MGEKEKRFIEYLGLLVSILILILIISYTINFRVFKANKCADRMIDYLCENDYKTFYKNLKDDNFSTWSIFSYYQDNVNRELGKIKCCKYFATYPSGDNDKDDVLVVYNVEYEKFQKQNIRIILEVKYNDNSCDVIQYKILPINDANSSEILDSMNSINSIFNKESDQSYDIKKFVENIIYEYDNENYGEIYGVLTDDLKRKGGQQEFINYLKCQHDKYGDLKNAISNGYEISKDQTEYKFNYYFKNHDTTYVTLWIKKSGGLYLSGIMFSEKTW